MWHIKSNWSYTLRQEAIREGDGKRHEKEITWPWQVHYSIQIVTIENQLDGHLAHQDEQWWLHILKRQENQSGSKQLGQLRRIRCSARREFARLLERGQWLQYTIDRMLQCAYWWWPCTWNPCSIWRRTEFNNWFWGRESKIGKLWQNFPLAI